VLKQVMINLVDNALKYSRHRDPAEVEIGYAGKEDGRVILFIRDNGAGFDMRYAHKLFGVFHRLHRAEEFEGTGIGLATVRRIISRHGGRTWAEGELGKGATFYFTLQPATNVKVTEVSDAHPEANSARR
jgi:light-regulated signal transduction histidine kinase (bacteriophytochrome)